MNRKTVVYTATLLTLAILNTGCVEKYFNSEKRVKNIETVESLPNITTEASNAECVDEIKPQKNNCDRGIIPAKEVNDIPEQGETYKLKSIRGKTIHIVKGSKGYSFPEYKSKIVLLEMFGKDCPHCINQLPIIKQIRNRYRGKLEVIAIQSQDRMSKFIASSYINSHKIRYPIIEGEDAINLQRDIQETFGWTGILPYILIIKNGIVTYIHDRGESSYKELKKDIDELL